MKVIYPPPSPEILSEFIIENNAINHIFVGHDDIEQTRTKTGYSPYVAGHLTAMKWGIDNCSKDPRWPADHPVQWSNTIHSDRNLHWLRTLHEKLNTPIAKYADRIAEESISIADCGHYRLRTKVQGLGRPMPRPVAIPDLLHHWFAELAEAHIKVRDNLRRPSMKQVTELAKTAQHLSIKLCCVHPFQKGNGITARLVENLMRLRWGLPWRVQHAKNATTYTESIMKLEDSPEWQAFLHSVNGNERPK